MAILINGVQVAGVGLPGKDGVDGKDAIVNGVNALNITATGGIKGQQLGDTYTLDGSGLMEKVSGLQGQFLGFTAKNVVGAVDAPTGGAGKRVCRFVVGTSTAGWTEGDCDYLCDGTDDQEEINAAIQALPETGGEIVILDGTYNITAPIVLDKMNSVIQGNGAATKLIREWVSTTTEGIINVSAVFCIISSICLDGKSKLYGSANRGIQISATNCSVIKSIFLNSTYAIYTKSGTGFVSITDNIFDGNKIAVSALRNECIILSNFYSNNTTAVDITADKLIISGNIFIDNETGISNWGTNNTIINNACIDNDIGIKHFAGDACTTSGNITIRGSGTASDYTSSQHTIYVSGGKNNLVSNNICLGKAPIDNGTNNTLVNNKYE